MMRKTFCVLRGSVERTGFAQISSTLCRNFSNSVRPCILKLQPNLCVSQNRWNACTVFVFKSQISTSAVYRHDSPANPNSEIAVKYQNGLAVLSVPLPSRKEKCIFTLRPVTSSLADFIEQLQAEDHGTDFVAAYTLDGDRVARTTSIDHLLRQDFYLVVNDVRFHVRVPEPTVGEGSEGMSDVKNAVVRLYRSLNIEEFQREQEQRLKVRVEHLRAQVEPLEQARREMELKAVRRTNILTWTGLGLMGVQFGLLARLTWWEYSWDIMEPVTYFVGYATLIAMFAYYCVTKQEYSFSDVRDREFLLTMHKQATKNKFDVKLYNELREAIAQAEYDITRLRDPLQLNLPMSHLDKKSASDIDPF